MNSRSSSSKNNLFAQHDFFQRLHNNLHGMAVGMNEMFMIPTWLKAFA